MKKTTKFRFYPLAAFILVFLMTVNCSKNNTNDPVPPATVTDIDGNIYHTVTIGTQVWMVEDLKTTKFNDGTLIPLVTDTAVWNNLISAGFCWFQNDAATYKATYGAIYNWHAVNTGKLAPVGWHVPTDTEWKILEMNLGMSQAQADTTGWARGTDEGGKMKEAGTLHWLPPNAGATNSSGFTGLPAGERYGSDGGFHGIGDYGAWWTSTEYDGKYAWNRCLSHDISACAHRGRDLKDFGFSVRCVRD